MEKRKKETQAEQVARLNRTPEGRALAGLVYGYPSQGEFAKAMDIPVATVANWIAKGRISKIGAEILDRDVAIPREEMRPDIKDWSKPEPGRKLGVDPDRSGDHQKAIAELAKHFGSIRAFAKAIDSTPSAINKWAHRNRIPYRQVLKLMEIGVPEAILKRIRP